MVLRVGSRRLVVILAFAPGEYVITGDAVVCMDGKRREANGEVGECMF